MNNRMLKTRGRKRHERSTRKKCINCTNWKERRPCKRSKRVTHRKRSSHGKRSSPRKRMYGGRSDDPTVRTIEGMPVTENALVSIPGKGIYGIKAFEEHEEDMDFQGPGATGYT